MGAACAPGGEVVRTPDSRISSRTLGGMTDSTKARKKDNAILEQESASYRSEHGCKTTVSLLIKADEEGKSRVPHS